MGKEKLTEEATLAVIWAAAELFLKAGDPMMVSLREIAARAGVSSRQLKTLFPGGREEILFGVLWRGMDTFHLVFCGPRYVCLVPSRPTTGDEQCLWVLGLFHPWLEMVWEGVERTEEFLHLRYALLSDLEKKWRNIFRDMEYIHVKMEWLGEHVKKNRHRV